MNAADSSHFHLVRPSLLIAAGLAVEALTLFALGPMPFLLFAGAGASLVLLGVADFSWRMLRAGRRAASDLEPGARRGSAAQS